tara:strand:- start:575 stop:814 length:240 start_codon:yes stop_codon:yes gene_type:complete
MFKIEDYNNFSTCSHFDKEQDIALEFWGKYGSQYLHIAVEHEDSQYELELDRAASLEVVSFIMKRMKLSVDELLISNID